MSEFAKILIFHVKIWPNLVIYVKILVLGAKI